MATAARAGGNPLALKLAAARFLAARGEAPPSGGAGSAEGAALPPEALAGIARAAAGLDEEARRLLRALALLRVPVAPSGLEAVAGAALAARRLPSLIERFLVEAAPGPRHALHPLAREFAASGALGEPDAAGTAHLAAAAHFESLRPTEGLAAALEAHHHLLAAGEAERAFRLLLEVLPDLRAAEMGAAILDLVRRTAGLLARPEPELLLAEAEALLGLQRLEAAGAVLDAIGRLPGCGAPLETRALLARGVLHRLAGWSGEAVALGGRALALAEEAHDGEKVAAALHVLAAARQRQGALAEAEDLCERALAIYERPGRTRRAVVVLREIAIICRKRGKIRDAVRLCERGLAIARAAGFRGLEAGLEESLGIIFRDDDHPERAIPRLEAARRLCDSVGNPGARANALCCLAECREVLGDLGEAADLARAAAAELEAIGERERALGATGVLATIRALEGRHEEALALFDRVVTGLGASRLLEPAATAMASRWVSLAALGRLDEAAAECGRAVALFERADLPRRRLWAAACLASIETRLGRAAEAASRCRRALAALTSAEGDPLAEVLALRVLDAAEEARGGRRESLAARREWTARLLAAAPAARGEAVWRLRWLGLPLPEDYAIRAGGEVRAVDLVDVCEVRADPGRFELAIDVPAARVHRAGKGWPDLRKRRILLDLLAFLASRTGTPLGAQAIFRGVWAQPGYDPIALRRVVQANVYRLRRLIERDAARPALLVSLPRAGRYVFDPEGRCCLIASRCDLVRFALDARERAILELLDAREALTTRESAGALCASERTAQRSLEARVRAGLAVRSGSGRATRYERAE